MSYHLGSPVQFVQQNGEVLAAIVVTAFEDRRADLVWFSPTGLKGYNPRVPFWDQVSAKPKYGYFQVLQS